MPAKVTDDYSAFPKSIQEVIPYVEGEVYELRNLWGVHNYLFIEDRKRCVLFSEAFGPLLGVFQSLIEEEIILQISRLTDKDSTKQPNLSLWSLTPAIQSAKNKSFGREVCDSLKKISDAVKNIRKVRHKQIAHFDRKSSLDPSVLPTIIFADFRMTLELMEEFLNLFHWEFESTTVGFDSLSPGEIVEAATMTACKSKAYDSLESQGKIQSCELEKIIQELLSK